MLSPDRPPLHSEDKLKREKIFIIICIWVCIILGIGFEAKTFIVFADAPTDMVNVTGNTDVEMLSNNLNLTEDTPDIEKAEIIAEYRSRIIQVKDGDIFFNKYKLCNKEYMIYVVWGTILILMLLHRNFLNTKHYDVKKDEIINHPENKNYKAFFIYLAIAQIGGPIVTTLIIYRNAIMTGNIENIVTISKADVWTHYLPKLVMSNTMYSLFITIIVSATFAIEFAILDKISDKIYMKRKKQKEKALEEEFNADDD